MTWYRQHQSTSTLLIIAQVLWSVVFHYAFTWHFRFRLLGVSGRACQYAYIHQDCTLQWFFELNRTSHGSRDSWRRASKVQVDGNTHAHEIEPSGDQHLSGRSGSLWASDRRDFTSFFFSALSICHNRDTVLWRSSKKTLNIQERRGEKQFSRHRQSRASMFPPTFFALKLAFIRLASFIYPTIRFRNSELMLAMRLLDSASGKLDTGQALALDPVGLG